MLHLLHLSNHIQKQKNFQKVRNSYRPQVELQWSLAFPWGHMTLVKRSGYIETKHAFPCARLRLSPWKYCVFQFMDIPVHSKMLVAVSINNEPMNFNPSLTAAKTWTGPMIIGGDFNWSLKDLPVWLLLQHNGWTESRTFSSIPSGK